MHGVHTGDRMQIKTGRMSRNYFKSDKKIGLKLCLRWYSTCCVFSPANACLSMHSNGWKWWKTLNIIKNTFLSCVQDAQVVTWEKKIGECPFKFAAYGLITLVQYSNGKKCSMVK